MNREQLDEIRARYEAHRGELHDYEGQHVVCCAGCDLADEFPALLAEIDRLNAQLAQAQQFIQLYGPGGVA